MSKKNTTQNIQKILDNSIKPNLTKIHNDGIYPLDSMKELGSAGAFSFFYENGENGLLDSILSIAQIGSTCGNTAFCAWCQNVLAWYLLRTKNATLKNRFLKPVSSGEILGGTGLSNPIKSYAGFESMYLKAVECEGGYIINGTLPWVSNIESNHIFGIVCKLDSKPYNIAGIAICDKNDTSITFKESAKFIALDGSATKCVTFSNYFLSNECVLGLPAEQFLLDITTGFLLLQTGMALGSINLSLDLIKKSNVKKGNINAILPLNENVLRDLRDEFLESIKVLASNFVTGDSEYLKSVLHLRLKGSELTLQASQSAMLHAGSSGYIANSKEQKLLLESYFVAIVSPSIRHILNELDSINKGGGVAKKWIQITTTYHYPHTK